MPLLGMGAMVTLYNAAMDCCTKRGKPGRALRTFERMRGMGVIPDLTSYDMGECVTLYFGVHSFIMCCGIVSVNVCGRLHMGI